jgi:hypothetical protein
MKYNPNPQKNQCGYINLRQIGLKAKTQERWIHIAKEKNHQQIHGIS